MSPCARTSRSTRPSTVALTTRPAHHARAQLAAREVEPVAHAALRRRRSERVDGHRREHDDRRLGREAKARRAVGQQRGERDHGHRRRAGWRAAGGGGAAATPRRWRAARAARTARRRGAPSAPAGPRWPRRRASARAGRRRTGARRARRGPAARARRGRAGTACRDGGTRATAAPRRPAGRLPVAGEVPQADDRPVVGLMAVGADPHALAVGGDEHGRVEGRRVADRPRREHEREGSHEHGEVHEPLAPRQRAAGDEREAEQRHEQQRLAAGERGQGDERAQHRHPPHGARVEVGVGREQHGDDQRRRRATRS